MPAFYVSRDSVARAVGAEEVVEALVILAGVALYLC